MPIEKSTLIIVLTIFCFAQYFFARWRATGTFGYTTYHNGADIVETTIDTKYVPEPMNLYLFPEGQSGTMCLDGSPTGYYTNAGSDSVDNKTWVISMQGGGCCFTRGSCKKRAKTQKGTSTLWKSTYDPSCFKSSRIEPDCMDCSKNPSFCQATQVRIPYCSGDGHIGTRMIADESSWDMYFQGHLSFMNIINKLKAEHGLDDATNVVFTGSSAGGYGVFNNIDSLQTALPNAIVKGASSAGWFAPGSLPTDQPNKTDSPPSDWAHWSKNKMGGSGNTMLPLLGALWQPMTHSECEAGQIAKKADPSLCLWVHNLYQYIKEPFYVVENQYDTNQLYTMEKLPKNGPYTTQWLEYVAMFGHAMRESTNQVLTLPHKNGDGLYHPSCLQHSLKSVVIGNDEWIPIFSDWFWGNGNHADKYILVETCPSSFNGLPCNANTALCRVPSDNMLNQTIATDEVEDDDAGLFR